MNDKPAIKRINFSKTTLIFTENVDFVSDPFIFSESKDGRFIIIKLKDKTCKVPCSNIASIELQ